MFTDVGKQQILICCHPFDERILRLGLGLGLDTLYTCGKQQPGCEPLSNSLPLHGLSLRAKW